MNDLLAEYEAFCQRLLTQKWAEEMWLDEVSPITAPQIDEFSQRNGVPVPADIRAFWLGFRQELRGYSGGPKFLFSVGFDFLTPTHHLESCLPDFRRIADLEEPDTLPFHLSRHGLPLTYDEPQLTWLPEDGCIYWRLYDGETPDYPVADSFTEFFTHYLAAGCFCSHSLRDYWPLVADIVPCAVPPADNKWLQFYARTYPDIGPLP
jgi:hypothetical protein